jgi:hypothetical protein
MSDTSNVVLIDGCKVSIRMTNSGIKVYFVPTRGEGTSFGGGKFCYVCRWFSKLFVVE